MIYIKSVVCANVVCATRQQLAAAGSNKGEFGLTVHNLTKGHVVAELLDSRVTATNNRFLISFYTRLANY
jgi:hypothetical protein